MEHCSVYNSKLSFKRLTRWGISTETLTDGDFNPQRLRFWPQTRNGISNLDGPNYLSQ